MNKGKVRNWWLKTKRKLFRHHSAVNFFRLLIISGLIGLFFYLLFPWLRRLSRRAFFGPKIAFSLLTADTSSLDFYQNRTNFLILGTGGEEHQRLDLTDTIIFVSVNRESADTVMLSLPRDIWLESLQTKINAVYHYGEKEKEGGGFVLIKDAVYQILNQPIHYVVLVDFQGFIKMIDLLGGISLKVDRSFDDYRYPIPGKERDECGGDPEYRCRYEHLHFEAGRQEMNGETALKFVRSRNAEGEEGTDFARSQRQQKVILALGQKLLSYQFLFSPAKIAELRKTFGDHIKFDTQFNENQLTAFLSLFLRFVRDKKEIRTISIDAGNEENLGFLYNPPLEEYNQWVLVPRADNWQEIQKYVEEKIYKDY